MNDYATPSTLLSKQSTTSTATGTAHGKIILIGEHAVVYQKPAIALPFTSVQVTATIEERFSDFTIDCPYYTGPVATMPQTLRHLQCAMDTSLQRVARHGSMNSEPNIHLSITSTIPVARGMGSSAAVSVAVVRAIFAHYQQDLPEHLLRDIVQASEMIAHGNPSGVDMVTTSSTHPVYYIKDRLIEPFQLTLNAFLVVADTGVQGHTVETVQSVAQLVDVEQSEPSSLPFSPSDHLIRLSVLTDRVKEALAQNDPVVVGMCLNEAHALLQQLSVSSLELDILVESAQSAGALGAKLTGGGRGGCMIALASDLETAQTIATALLHAGATQTWIQSLS